MKRPKTKKTKLKLADSTLNISEKLFLAPYLAIAGYILNLDKLSFTIILLLSFFMIGFALKFKNDALTLYDEVYSEETVLHPCK